MTSIRFRTIVWAALSIACGAVTAAQAPSDEPAYVVRGKQTEAHQRALRERMDRFHDALAQALARDAPELLPNLEPPAPAVFGYRILPRIPPDAPPPPPSKPQVVSYSWGYSDTLFARETAGIERLEARLARISTAGRDKAAYSALAADYRKAVESRRPVDADVDYNWLWQKQIAANRPLFDRLTTNLNAAVERQARGEPIAPEQGLIPIGIDPPSFLRVDPPADHQQVLTVPFYTDIEDAAALQVLTSGIENHWHVRDGTDEFRVHLLVEVISPERLYCAPADDRAAPATRCAPPAKGDHIDLEAHVARFPKDGAVLTTGAASIQLVAGRAIVLSAHDATPRVVAHEFGHVLGFHDAYLRGYKDLGADGFRVLEFTPDATDLMAASGAGEVLVRHFRGLIAARDMVANMESGLDALYRRREPVEAVARFRRVLEIDPSHYGATLQLAKALDGAGQTDEALTWWKKILDMAEAVNDAETTATARGRLAQDRSQPAPTR